MHDLAADLVVPFGLSHISSLAHGASLLVLVGADPPQGDQGRIGDGMVEGLHQEGVMSVGGTSSNSPCRPKRWGWGGAEGPAH